MTDRRPLPTDRRPLQASWHRPHGGACGPGTRDRSRRSASSEASKPRFPAPKAPTRSASTPRTWSRCATGWPRHRFYFPEGAEEPLPVIQIRTPRETAAPAENSAARWFASHGFAVAVQDMRGDTIRGEYFVSRDDRRDGYDMVSWLAGQPWSNGRIGTYGCSYLGENQMRSPPPDPNHAAALPQAAGGSLRYFGLYFGGATELAASLGWFRGAGSKVFYRIPPGTPRDVILQVEEMINPAPSPGELDFQAAWRTLPYIDMLKAAGAPPTDFEDFISHEPGDPWWDHIGYVTPEDRFDVPSLHVNSWYDLGVSETLKLFNLLSDNAESDRARDNQYAIISPTDHCTSEIATSRTVVGERDLGDARLDYWNIYLRWFNHWLRDGRRRFDSAPPVLPDGLRFPPAPPRPPELAGPSAHGRFNAPVYRDEAGRPAPTPRRRAARPRPGRPPSDQPPRLVTTTLRPVPTFRRPGAARHPRRPGRRPRPVASRPRSACSLRAAHRGLEAPAPPLVLYVSSDARDTDFVAKWWTSSRRHPDQRPEGIQRARYREGYGRKVWMEKDEVYEVLWTSGNGEPLPARTPHPLRSPRRFPALGPQPEHRRQQLRRDRLGGRTQRRAPRARSGVPRRASRCPPRGAVA